MKIQPKLSRDEKIMLRRVQYWTNINGFYVHDFFVGNEENPIVLKLCERNLIKYEGIYSYNCKKFSTSRI